MAVGTTNAGQAEAKLASGEMLCYYRAAYAVSTASSAYAGYQHDYLSFSNPTFTVLKPFTATLNIFAKGTYNQNGSSRNITYNFKKNGSSLYTATIGASGDANSYSVSFVKNDTFTITASKDSDSTTNYGEAGFSMKIS